MGKRSKRTKIELNRRKLAYLWLIFNLRNADVDIDTILYIVEKFPEYFPLNPTEKDLFEFASKFSLEDVQLKKLHEKVINRRIRVIQCVMFMKEKVDSQITLSEIYNYLSGFGIYKSEIKFYKDLEAILKNPAEFFKETPSERKQFSLTCNACYYKYKADGPRSHRIPLFPPFIGKISKHLKKTVLELNALDVCYHCEVYQEKPDFGDESYFKYDDSTATDPLWDAFLKEKARLKKYRTKNVVIRKEPKWKPIIDVQREKLFSFERKPLWNFILSQKEFSQNSLRLFIDFPDIWFMDGKPINLKEKASLYGPDTTEGFRRYSERNHLRDTWLKIWGK